MWTDETLFQDLFQPPSGLLLALKDNDVGSMGDSFCPLTATAQRFLDYVAPWIEEAPHCFWSGRGARTKAQEQSFHTVPGKPFLTDDKVPLIAALFRLTWRCPDAHQRKRISFAISRLFAMHAAGPDVHVFLHSDKPSEPTGLTVGTNLWEAELPVLMNRVRSLALQQVWFHVRAGERWLAPQRHHQFFQSDVPLYRRYVHPSLDDLHVCFVRDEFLSKEYDRWREHPPRRGIALNGLHALLRRWRALVTIRQTASLGGVASS